MPERPSSQLMLSQHKRGGTSTPDTSVPGQRAPEAVGPRHTPQAMGKNQTNDTRDEEEKLKLLYLQYVRGVSERIEQECKKLGVKAVWTHPQNKFDESEERETG